MTDPSRKSGYRRKKRRTRDKTCHCCRKIAPFCWTCRCGFKDLFNAVGARHLHLRILGMGWNDASMFSLGPSTDRIINRTIEIGDVRWNCIKPSNSLLIRHCSLKPGQVIVFNHDKAPDETGYHLVAKRWLRPYQD